MVNTTNEFVENRGQGMSPVVIMWLLYVLCRDINFNSIKV